MGALYMSSPHSFPPASYPMPRTHFCTHVHASDPTIVNDHFILHRTHLHNLLQEQYPERMPGSLPAFWPTFNIRVGSTTSDSDSQGTAEQRKPPSQASPASSSSPGGPPIMTYAELLACETSAMRNAQGPWRPRIEKTEELLVGLQRPQCFPEHASGRILTSLQLPL